MPVAEILLTAIADAVFGYAFEKSADKLGEWAREKLNNASYREKAHFANGITLRRDKTTYFCIITYR